MYHQQKATNLMIDKIKHLFQLQLLRDALKLSSGNVLSYVIPMVVTPILSRLYSPEQFGEWGVFSSSVSILGCILVGGWQYAIIKCEQHEIRFVIKLCLIAALSILILSACFWGLAKIFELPIISQFPCPIGFLIFLAANAIVLILSNLATRYERYWTISAGNLTIGISQAILRVVFAVFAIFVNGLIVGTICAQIIGCLFFFIMVHRDLKCCNTPDMKQNITIKSIAKKYKKFPLYDAPAQLLSIAAFNLPVIILAVFYSKTEIGGYSMVLQLLLMPISVIGSAIGQVYYQRISTQTDNYSIYVETNRVLKIVLWLAILPTAFFCVGGDWVLVKFLGDKWQATGGIALSLSLWSIVTIITQPLLPLYRTANKQDRMFGYNVLYFIIGIGAIWLCSYLHLQLYETIMIYSVCAFFPRAFMLGDILKIAYFTSWCIMSKRQVVSYIGIVIILIIRLNKLL